MRLTRQQINSLVDAAHQSFGDNAAIWLFGSRVDDSKRGGDIDLNTARDSKFGIWSAPKRRGSIDYKRPNIKSI